MIPRFRPNRASRGNSGSPVFVCSTGKFAGIVFGQAADTVSIIDDAKQKVARMPYGASLAAHVFVTTSVLHLRRSPVLAPPTSLLHLHDTIPASAIRKFLEAR